MGCSCFKSPETLEENEGEIEGEKNQIKLKKHLSCGTIFANTQE